jgi:hypothetical protein
MSEPLEICLRVYRLENFKCTKTWQLYFNCLLKITAILTLKTIPGREKINEIMLDPTMFLS